jgi:hypothetical protein
MMDLLEWIFVKLGIALGHAEIAAGALGLMLGMATVEFTARMLPAAMPASIATRISWAVSCVIAFAVAFVLNQTPLGFAIALTAAVSAPSLQIFIIRAIAARYPKFMPPAMAENERTACPPLRDRPSDVHWP